MVYYFSTMRLIIFVFISISVISGEREKNNRKIENSPSGSTEDASGDLRTDSSNDPPDDLPLIMVVLLARNKEHTLPYFLTLFERLNYPKRRLSLYIRADHCDDKTIPLLEKWLDEVGNNYHSMDVKMDSNSMYYDEEPASYDSTDATYEGIIKLKEEAFSAAKSSPASYVLFLDVDVYITDPDIIQLLLEKQKTIVSPMLNSYNQHSNFWAAMTPQFWYKNSDDYSKIIERKKTGCFAVPMVHSIVLINLNAENIEKLTFNPKILADEAVPYDDIITFAVSAQRASIELNICNEKVYGFFTPPQMKMEKKQVDEDRLKKIRLEALNQNEILHVSNLFTEYLRPPQFKVSLGIDEIYFINLKRRPDRKKIMFLKLEMFGQEAVALEAVDGKELTGKDLTELGIYSLPGYRDPIEHRLMTFGEVGCFLSHYIVWKNIIDEGHESVLILEDDARLENTFRWRIREIMNHVKDIDLDWDLIYVGRKRMDGENEIDVENSDLLINCSYSHWTIGYILSKRGAQKLIDAEPFENFTPVDEYIPIMSNVHPNKKWMEYFPNRNLKTFAMRHLVVKPVRYYKEEGYVSDTAASDTIDRDDLEDFNSIDEDLSSLVDDVVFDGTIGINPKIKDTPSDSSEDASGDMRVDLPYDPPDDLPLIMVVLLARNKEHTLPYFLTLFERLHYPKKRLSLYIRADHCDDKTIPLLEKWLDEVGNNYHSMDVKMDRKSVYYDGELGSYDLQNATYEGIIKLKEEAFSAAKYSSASYVLFLDVDVYITDPDIIKLLLEKQKTIVSPMLNSYNQHSNFWTAMTPQFWYKNSDDYSEIIDREETGCFAVPMVHSIVLINLNAENIEKLTFNPKILADKAVPYDDIITFAVSAQRASIELNICNEKVYGFFTPPQVKLEKKYVEKDRLEQIKLEALNQNEVLHVSDLFMEYLRPIQSKVILGIDEIYFINLKRRPDRKELMFLKLEMFGLYVVASEAVDGRELTERDLLRLGIVSLPGYRNPYENRLLTFGEIGCFLSHYNIWKDVIDEGHESVLILEDDARLESTFQWRIRQVMDHVKDIDLDWDLIYVGRNIFNEDEENAVENSDLLIKSGRSDWTIGYIISNSGAQKLIDAKPLEKLAPVDTYLQILSNNHPNKRYKEQFPKRDLLTFALRHLVVNPSKYYGEEGHVSDTATSDRINRVDFMEIDSLPDYWSLLSYEEISGKSQNGHKEFDLKLSGDIIPKIEL